MRKLIFIPFLLLSSFISSAQTLCDSITYSIVNPGSGILVLEGNVNALSGITIDLIIWDWQVCDTVNCYISDSSVATFTNLTGDSCSLHMYVYVIANGDTCELNIADSLIYGTNGWEALEGDHLTFISEIKLEDYIFDDRIFDLFGREYYTHKLIPFGSMYIQNGKKYIKLK